MRIIEIKVHFITLPFIREFSHSLRKGYFSNNIIVEVISEEGFIGYGEGAPRPYVTGECQAGIPRSISALLESELFPWDIHSVSQIWAFVDSLPKGAEHNSALCALEIAMLDGVAKSEGRSIVEYFEKNFFSSTVHYGAAIPLSSKRRIVEACNVALNMGIRRVKLKMGADFKQNQDAFEGVCDVFGEDCELKIDVNGAWDREKAYQHVPLAAKYKIKAVEQPLMPNNRDIYDVAKSFKQIGAKVMADESACSLQDIKALAKEGCYDMINVRLSKCGGFRRSLEIVSFLRREGIPFQIACQLGESGILSAAGRILSLLCRDALYHEGSYDEFLLKENVTKNNVSFGWGGKAGRLGGVGLGVDVDTERLIRLKNGFESISFIK